MKPRGALTMSGQYKQPFDLNYAKSRAISKIMLTAYATALHTNPEVVANLKFAHEADPAIYGEEELNNLGNLVTALMHKIGKGYAADYISFSYGWSAFSDFNAWYLQEVVYGGEPFEATLSRYLKVSPYIKWEGGQ
jgi:hypothetical protein